MNRSEIYLNIDTINTCIQAANRYPDLYEFLARLNFFGLIPVCVIGIILNAVALLCLERPIGISSGAVVYLKAVLTLDILQLATSSTQAIPFYCDSEPLWWACIWYRRYLQLIMGRLVATVDTMHLWIIVAVSAHRYWKIIKPVSARALDTILSARYCISTIILAAIIFRLPLFFELSFEKFGNTSYIGLNYRFVYRWSYNVAYYGICNTLLYHVTPMVLIGVLGAATLRGTLQGIRRRSELVDLRHHSIGSDEGNLRIKEARVAACILLWILVYILCHILSLYELARRWLLVLSTGCLKRHDFVLIELNVLLTAVAATLNAFLFIAITTRVVNYVGGLVERVDVWRRAPPKSPPNSQSHSRINISPAISRILGNNRDFIQFIDKEEKNTNSLVVWL